MDSDTIKLLLESQVRAFRSAMDIVVEQFNCRISAMEKTISDLTKSLEFTQAEVQDFKGELKASRRLETENKAKIQEYEKQIKDLELKLNYQEDYSRRNNLRISGLDELRGGETWEQTSTLVTDLLKTKLQLPSINLERAHRVGSASSSRPRTAIVRFEKFGDREAVLRNARKLKGSGIYINEDLCSASQAIKQGQLPLLKQARSQGKIAFFKHTRLVIKERMSQQSPAASYGSAGAGASGSATPASTSSSRDMVGGGPGGALHPSRNAARAKSRGKAGEAAGNDGEGAAADAESATTSNADVGNVAGGGVAGALGGGSDEAPTGRTSLSAMNDGSQRQRMDLRVRKR